MARCGCVDDEANRNVMRAGCGIAISGEGTTTSPRLLELIASDCMCGVIQSCVTDKVCEGLSTEGGCLGVKISTNAGNRLRLGDDGGLFADCGTAAVNECVARVSALPAFVCGGTFGAGNNVAEEGVRYSYELADSLGVDLTLAKVFRLCDGSFYVGPARTMADVRYRVPFEEYVRPTDAIARLNTNNVQTLRVAPDTSYGVCTPEADNLIYGLEPAGGVLASVRNKVPLSLELPTGDGTSAATDVTSAELLTLLTRACALDRVIVHVEGTATDAERGELRKFSTVGYETGVYLATPEEAAVHTPAKLQADDVKWVYAHKTLSDALIRTYVQAGRQVLIARCLQQVDVTRAQALGVRGVLAEDPSYVCGEPCGTDRGPWCTNAVPSGQISMDQITSGSVRGNRGLKTGLTSECAWSMPYTGPLPAMANATLLGWAGWGRLYPPIGYKYSWDWRSPDVGVGQTGNRLGLLVACTDDTAPLEGARRTPLESLNPARVSGYLCVTNFGWSAAATIMQIWKLTKGEAPVQLAQFFQGGSPWTENQWIRASVEVTETQIIFGLGLNEVGFPTWGSVTATDSEHRGRTVWAYGHATDENVPTTLRWDMRNWVRS